MDTHSENPDIGTLMNSMGKSGRFAAASLREAREEQKNIALVEIAQAISDSTKEILFANALDLDRAKKSSLAPAMIDRLVLDSTRLSSLTKSLDNIVALPDPIGTKLSSVTRPNGLEIEKVRTPIGVIALIYESRPNVTVDASALCIKSGNASILRCGSQAFETSKALYQCIQSGLIAADLPKSCVQLVPTIDRAAVGEILAGLDDTIDLIIPRGGKSLVARVQEEARAPVLSHLDGVCHVYVDGEADIEKAVDITINAKMRRPGICGAAETLLIDNKQLEQFLPPLVNSLLDAGCRLKADDRIAKTYPTLEKATESDFFTEYLAPILSIATVDGVEGAIDHIGKYSSGHTETIITENHATAARFLNTVDSAIVMHNASTQFADGGEFGLGAEIGIATGRLHARGPVGLEELTTYKYVVHGTGQIRP